MSFSNITSFELYQNTSENDDITFIKVRKNENELGKVELSTYVLYIKDGDNYKYTHAGKTGSYWGFPLFDINSNVWQGTGAPKYNNTNSKRNDIFIWSSNKIVILDFKRMKVDHLNSTTKIPLEHLVIRLTKSEEDIVNKWDMVVDGTNVTLIKYVFYGDIINPYSCLEINTNFFVYKKNSKYYLAGTIIDPQTAPDTAKEWIKFDDDSQKNSYLNLDINIHSNINSIIYDKDTNTWSNLILNTINEISFTENATLTSNENNEATNNYQFKHILWSSLTSPRHLQIYPIELSERDHAPRYIRNFIDISGRNCIGGGYAGTRTGVEFFNFSTNTNSGDVFSQTYANFNTIDLPRITDKPYYGGEKNENTGNWNNLLTVNQYADVNSYSNINSENNWGTTKADIPTNSFKVYFKLLYKPEDTNSYVKLILKFGKNTNSKVTFFRYDTMEGEPEPSGKSYIDAIRNKECISLRWDANSFEIENDTYTYKYQNIVLFDVASGVSSHSIQIQNNINLSNTELNIDNYTIKCNIFQLRIFNINDSGSIEDLEIDSGLTFTPKIFNTDANASTVGHQYKLKSSIPNYSPFRYINTVNDGDVIRTTKNTNPLLKQSKEEYLYFVSKQFLNGNSANIIQNYSDDNLSDNVLSFPRETNGNIFQLFPYNGEKEINNGNIIIFSKPILPVNTDIPIFRNRVSSLFVDLESGIFRRYPSPEATNIKNNFISDYWQWIDEISFLATRINISEDDLVSLKNYIVTIDSNTITEEEFTSFNFSNTYTEEELSYDFNILKNENDVITLTKVIEELNIKTYNYFKNQATISATASLYNIFFESSNKEQIKYMLVNTFNESKEISYMDLSGKIVTNPRFRVVGTESLQNSIEDRPIILSVTGGGVSVFNSGIYYIGNDGSVDSTRGINKPEIDWTFQDIFTSKNEEIQNTVKYNSTYNIFISGSKLISQNQPFSGIRVLPYPIILNLVEINKATQFWPRIYENGEPIQDYNEMVTSNSKGVTIQWNYLNNVDKTEGTIYWLIKKKNLITLQETIINEENGGLSIKKPETIVISASGQQNITINTNNDTYEFTDNDIRVYDKFQYTIEGIFKWDTLKINRISVSTPLSILIPGFETPPIFVCKNNRFPYGRFNTTSTNLKLFKPLNNLSQCYKINYIPTRKIQSNNNIYHNTTNQLTKKQIFKWLATSSYRPFR